MYHPFHSEFRRGEADQGKDPVTVTFDSFLRNFFIRNKMNETLENFQQEWYELQQKGGGLESVSKIPE